MPCLCTDDAELLAFLILGLPSGIQLAAALVAQLLDALATLGSLWLWILFTRCTNYFLAALYSPLTSSVNTAEERVGDCKSL